VKLQLWWWRDLLKVCREGGGDGWFQKEIGWKVGCGDKVKFWEDVWVGNSNLKSLYPKILEEVGEWEDEVWRWRLGWRRARFEWESVLEAKLTIHISTTMLSKEEKDIQVWGNDEKGCFTINAAYEYLAKHERGSRLDVYETLWKSKAFPSVLTTTWRVLMDRIPTRECLSRRGVTMNSILRALCQTKNESCQHLFLECRYAMSVWSMCYRWMGILSVQHNDLKTHFESFQFFQVSYNQNLVWKGVWTTIVRFRV